MKQVLLVGIHMIAYGCLALWLNPVAGLEALLFASILIWVSTNDIILFEIPDIAVGALLILAFVFRPADGSLATSIGAAASWGSIYWLVAWIAKHLLGQPGLGLGDVKLMAALASWLGFSAPIMVTLWAALAGILCLVVFALLDKQRISHLRGTGLAFGPFLCMSAWGWWLATAGSF